MTSQAIEIPYIAGRLQHVLDPPGKADDPPKRDWYINDHCLFNDGDRMHFFGISNPYSPQKKHYGPGTHRHIAHASTDTPLGQWQVHPHAFALPEGTEENIGACFVVRDDAGGYVMLFGFNTGFHIGRSDDLMTWRKLTDEPVIDLGCGKRDPCVVRLDDGTYLLYGAAGCDGMGAVVLAESTDLIHWQQLPPALLSDVPGESGPLESPFVHRRCDLYYLFVNFSHRQYPETLVFVSDDPRRFDWGKPLTTTFAHAAEIVEFGCQTYISHCGIEDWQAHWRPGLWLEQLGWARV